MPVLYSFSHAKVSCFSIPEALCVSSSLFGPHSSSFFSSILSLAWSSFVSLRQFVLGVSISKVDWDQVLQGYGGKGGIINAGTLISRSQIEMAETAASANWLQEVTSPVHMCTLPLSFSYSHQNQYDVFHCPEHSLRCWNTSGNPASWNYLVIDQHTEKCCPLVQLFFQPTLNIWQFS